MAWYLLFSVDILPRRNIDMFSWGLEPWSNNVLNRDKATSRDTYFGYLSFKGTVAPLWVWQQLVWLERTKIGKEPLSILNILTAPLTFNKCEQKCGRLGKRDGNCQIYANSRWEMLPPLLLAGCRYLGISQRLVYIYHLRISQRLPNSLWEFPSGFPIPF
jgi:hypothetical protein